MFVSLPMGEKPVVSLPGRTCAIKLLDLLTNRYHVGVVQAAGQGGLAIEMPRTTRLSAGQRVQYVLANDTSAVLPRRYMRQALVRHVDRSDGARVRADLAMMEESGEYSSFS
jgi:hypothetical protein